MKKIKLKKVFLLIICFAILGLAGVCLLMQRQTYNIIETVKQYEYVSADNPGYHKFLDGILKYTRDGVAFISKEGEEHWNQPCQMKNPAIDIRGEVVVVYDKGGTSILVFVEEGLKGEIKTTKPIEKISVSKQGIVAAILRDEEVPLVMCYDATGNTLVQQNASLDNTGFPMDVAISNDGSMLLVSYLLADGSGISSRIVYYDFGDEDIEKPDYQVGEQLYPGIIIPMATYLNKETSMMLGDDSLILYKGTNEPSEVAKVSLETICNVAYSENMIAILVKNIADSTYKLQVYSLSGELVSEVALTRDYNEMKVYDNQVFLYEGNVCGIYSKQGICKFEGDVNINLLEVYPIFGLNKYMMISADGFYEVRLAK